ncbi:MAG TPA: TA system VapC family ribonuclease toxin [Vicinamibacteria bacterium]|nr:TA system VapC family ribonuclease toxin [Vicinamibacteria bacterium]
MNLCDSNVWLALTLSKHVHHQATRAWLEHVDEPESVCFVRATQQALLRLLTNASVLEPYGNPPLTNREAWNVYDAFLGDDRIVLHEEEPAGLEILWKKFALGDSASPKIWMDSYLAAFALAGGYCMVTTDAGFKHYRGLNLEVLGASDPQE